MEQTRPTGTGLRATLAALAALIALAAVAAHAGGASARQLDTSGSASPAHSTSLSGDTRAAQLIRHSIVARLGTAARPTGASAASSAISGSPCGDTPGLICSQIDVPLDHTGQTQGTVSLHVETLPAFGAQKGVMFLIAGGPGQGSAHVFGLGSPDSVILYRYLFPGYTLVAYDDRGTGSSGLLNCPALQGNVSVEQEDKIAAACADSIGPNRAFYSTRDHAEDIESVRLALGVDKVALWGTSYGTKLAMAYALAHPDHVERLLLDSVVPPDLNDPFGASDLREMPTTLSALCAETSCRTADANLARDVATLANRLAAKPIQGKVRLANGKTRATRISGVDLLSLVIDADLSPGLAAELPATVKAALQGNVQPLLRLYDLDAVAGSEPAEDLSAGLYAATVCRDGPFPWTPETPVQSRQAIYDAAVKAVPAGYFGPFGTWAASFGTAHFCLSWPSPAGGAGLGPGPLPNVPVLALSGGIDMRTPTSGARDVVSRFPQGKLLVVPGVGHSVVGADISFCSGQAVRSWMLGGAVPASCDRPKPLVSFVPPFPAAPSKPKPLGARQTLSVVSKTIREAEALWLMSSATTPIAGVYGGRLVPSAGRDFRLDRYSIAPGVEVSGRIRFASFGPPLTFEGAVTVGGSAAAAGVLGLAKGTLGGTLAGEIVRGT